MFEKPYVQISRNFSYLNMLNVAVASSSPVTTTQCVMYFRFVDDAMFSRNAPYCAWRWQFWQVRHTVAYWRIKAEFTTPPPAPTSSRGSSPTRPTRLYTSSQGCRRVGESARILARMSMSVSYNAAFSPQRYADKLCRYTAITNCAAERSLLSIIVSFSKLCGWCNGSTTY